MAKDKDGKKLKVENSRYHVVKTCQQVAGTLRDAAELIDSFGKQLAAFPLSGFSENANFDLPALALGAKSDEDGDDSGGGKKKRKRGEGKDKDKKPKDPNAPKRPPSAYLLYQNDVRQTMKELHKDLPYREVLSEISKSWAKMSDADKKVYVDATELAKQAYTEKKAEYDKSHGPPPKDDDKEDESALAKAESPAKATESGESSAEEESSEEQQQESDAGSEEESSEEESEKEPPKKKSKKAAAVVEEEEPPKKKQKKAARPASEDESPKRKARGTPAKDKRKRKD